MIEWQDLHHSELSVSQLYALLQLRCAVFVVEKQEKSTAETMLFLSS